MGSLVPLKLRQRTALLKETIDIQVDLVQIEEIGKAMDLVHVMPSRGVHHHSAMWRRAPPRIRQRTTLARQRVQTERGRHR